MRNSKLQNCHDWLQRLQQRAVRERASDVAQALHLAKGAVLDAKLPRRDAQGVHAFIGILSCDAKDTVPSDSGVNWCTQVTL